MYSANTGMAHGCGDVQIQFFVQSQTKTIEKSVEIMLQRIYNNHVQFIATEAVVA